MRRLETIVGELMNPSGFRIGKFYYVGTGSGDLYEKTCHLGLLCPQFLFVCFSRHVRFSSILFSP